MKKTYFVYLHHKNDPERDKVMKVAARSTLGARMYAGTLVGGAGAPFDIGAAYTPTEAKRELKDWAPVLERLDTKEAPE